MRTIGSGKTASMANGDKPLVGQEVSQMTTFSSLVEVGPANQILSLSLGSGAIEDLFSFSKTTSLFSASASSEGGTAAFNGTTFLSVAAPSPSSSILSSFPCFSYHYLLSSFESSLWLHFVH